MSSILLCNEPVQFNTLEKQCNITPGDITGLGCVKPSILSPYTPYLESPNPSSKELSLLTPLASTPIARELTHLSLSFGGDNTLALADISAQLQTAGTGMLGASTSVYGNRVQGFEMAVEKYQKALMSYRAAIKTSPAAKTLAKQNVTSAYQSMQVRFGHELKAATGAAKSQRGTPLSNPTRALNIARSSRNVAKLDITSQAQASNLAKFGKHAKFLGNGLAVIDFTSGVGNIHNSYQAGGNWERDMFIESLSFATSATAGILAAKAGAAALTFLMVATPIGWVGLIIGGIAVAGVAAGISIATNNAAKDNGGDIYDSIMGWLNF